jgi:hypothetical protein
LTRQIKRPNFGAIVSAIIDAILPQQVKTHEKSSRIANSPAKEAFGVVRGTRNSLTSPRAGFSSILCILTR